MGLLATTSCCGDCAPDVATVIYQLDAPLCSSQLPVEFSIDSALVGSDTFRVNLSPNHTQSRPFAVSAGRRRLGARVVNGYIWPDTVVQLVGGQVFTDSLPFYCS